MHGSLQANAALLSSLKAGLPSVLCDVAVCVPYPYLGQVGSLVEDSGVLLGAQSVSEFSGGAYTGEVAGGMLRDLGCKLVLVGHSERRTLFGETDAVVAAKFEAAHKVGLTPVLCVGETFEERKAGATLAVVARQLSAVIDRVGVSAFANAVVAYEPVWAIGTGLTASPAEAQAVHIAIRGQFVALNAGLASELRVLYGGSVKPENAGELFSQPDIDGGLIGGAALVAEDFLAICRAAV